MSDPDTRTTRSKAQQNIDTSARNEPAQAEDDSAGAAGAKVSGDKSAEVPAAGTYRFASMAKSVAAFLSPKTTEAPAPSSVDASNEAGEAAAELPSGVPRQELFQEQLPTSIYGAVPDKMAKNDSIGDAYDDDGPVELPILEEDENENDPEHVPLASKLATITAALHGQFADKIETETSRQLAHELSVREQAFSADKAELQTQLAAQKKMTEDAVRASTAAAEEMRQEMASLRAGMSQMGSPPGATSPGSELALAAAASQLSAAAEHLAAGKDTVKRIDFNVYEQFPFMRAYNGAVVKNKIEVTVTETMPYVPSDTKADVARAFDAVGAKRLDIFNDAMGHHDYLLARRALVKQLGGIAFHQLGRGHTAEEAEYAAFRPLSVALDAVSALDEHKRIGLVARAVKTDGISTILPVLKLMDRYFLAASPIVAGQELVARLDENTYAHGVLPSIQITTAIEIFNQKYADPDLADQEARSYIIKSMRDQATKYSFLMPFSQKLLDISFAARPLTEWYDQFKMYESDGIPKADGKATGKAAAGGAAKGGAADKMIGAVLGWSPTETAGVEVPDEAAAILQSALSMALGFSPSETKANSSGGNIDFLKSMIAQVGGGAQGDAWVAQHGVVGFKAPNDAMREILHIGKIAQACDIEVSAACPKDPDAYVGFHCPCNKFRNVPEDAWYWNPQSEEFKSGKPEYAKVKPLDLMTFGYMHKLGKCRTMRAKAHAKAKENPALISLLVPLPKGTKDCITIAGGG